MKRNRDFEKEKEILKRQQKHTENTEENNFSYEMENEKIESLYVTREMAEDKEMDEKIRQDLIHVADQAEKEFQEEEALGAPRMKPEEKQQLFDDIVGELKKKGIWEESPEDQLSAEDREALRLGRELLHTPKKKKSTILPKILKGITGAAVVALGVFVLSMSSEANRVKLLSAWNSIVGDELRIDINNSGNNNDNEEEVYKSIEEKLKIKSLRFIYKPLQMEFMDYNINEQIGSASIFYLYDNDLITVYMLKQERGVKQNQQFDGNVIDSIKLYTNNIQANIWKIKNEDKNAYATAFNYNNTYYSVWGSMPQEEFEKMISEINF